MASKNTQKRDSAISFGLSFLDVLCCGLGASVLLFLIVKHGPTVVDAATDDSDSLDQQIALVSASIDKQRDERATLRRTLTASEEQIAAVERAIRATDDAQNQRTQEVLELLAQLKQAKQRLEQEQANFAQAQLDYQIEQQLADQGSKQSDLTGIGIKDDKVVILLDRSASMLSDSLVEILRLRLATSRQQQNADKWVTAKHTARWAYDKVPNGARYRFLRFSDEVLDESGAKKEGLKRLDWLRKDTAQNPLGIESSVMAARPEGATNLQLAFEQIAQLEPPARQVILITDGLPTVPGQAEIWRVRDCPKLRRKQYLSPACRQRVFERARSFAETKLRGVQFEIILLPLQGDSRAVFHYWTFAAATGGRLLTPAAGWPHT